MVQGEPLYQELSTLFDQAHADVERVEDGPIDINAAFNDVNNDPPKEVIIISEDEQDAPAPEAQVEENGLIVISDDGADENRHGPQLLELIDGFGVDPNLNYEADSYESKIDYGSSDKDDIQNVSSNSIDAPGEVVDQDDEKKVDDTSPPSYTSIYHRLIPPSPHRFRFYQGNDFGVDKDYSDSSDSSSSSMRTLNSRRY